MIKELNMILDELESKGSNREELEKIRSLVEPYLKQNKTLDIIMKELINEITNETKRFIESKNKDGINYLTGFSSSIYLPTFDGSGEINLLLTGGYGSRENNNLKINYCTMFDVASITKLFTLILTLKLSEEGIINLDDKIADINPDFKGLEDFTFNDLIRLHGILDTKGCASKAENKFEAFRILKTLYLKDNTRKNNKYTDFGAIIIGKTIERIMSEKEGRIVTLNDLMDEYIYKKAGMTNTTYNPKGDNISGNGGYDTLVHDPITRIMGGILGSAGIFTTSSDLNRLAKSLYSVNYANVSLLSKRNLQKLGEITFPNSEQSGKGNLGVYVKSPNPNKTFVPLVFSKNSFAHQGWTGAIALFDPNNNIHFNFLPNAILKAKDEFIKNDKPVGYINAWSDYQEAIINNIMVMLIIKKYFNLYKNQDIEINKQIKI